MPQLQQAIDDVLAGRVQACGRTTLLAQALVRVDYDQANDRYEVIFRYGPYGLNYQIP